MPLLQCVGIRLSQYTTAVLKDWMKFQTPLTRTMNSCKIGSVAKLEGSAAVAVEFLSRWPTVSAATSV